MSQVQEILKQSYNHLGSVSTDDLPVNVLLTNLQSVIDKRLLDLNLTDNNHLLKSAIISVDGTNSEYPLTVSDFSEAIRLEYSIDGGITFFGNVEFVAFQNLYLDRSEGKLTASIYGSPAQLQFSLVPDSSLTFRIWYEPKRAVALRLAQEPNLSSFFHSFLALEAAAMSVVDVSGKDGEWKRLKQETLVMAVRDWEIRWQKWTTKPSNTGVVKKRRYNERRARTGNF
jgi:hypothetical protein